MYNAKSQSVSSLRFERKFDFEVEFKTVATPIDDGIITFKANLNHSETPSLLKFSLRSKKLSII